MRPFSSSKRYRPIVALVDFAAHTHFRQMEGFLMLAFPIRCSPVIAVLLVHVPVEGHVFIVLADLGGPDFGLSLLKRSLQTF